MRIARDMPISAEWYGIAGGDDVFVAVAKNSDYGAYMLKGNEWEQTSLPVVQQWQNVAYGDGVFIAVAKNSNIGARSKDKGKTWEEITLADTKPWNDICYGGNKFVVICGGAGDVCQYINYSSDNGDTWISRKLPCSDRWYSVCYGDGVYVALGNNSAAYSTDCDIWKPTQLPANGEWRSVCYDDGKFIALLTNSSIVAYSVDGITWFQTNLPSARQWYSIAHGNGRFFALAYNSFAFSSDGIKWEEQGLDEEGYWYSLCYNNSCFVSIGYGSNNVLYSFDGAHVYYYAHGDLSLNEKLKLAGISDGTTNITVEDVLTSTSTTNALSANQGKILNDTKLPISGGTITGDLTVNGTLTNANLAATINSKVDKVDGKGLSTEDFTTAEKQKLAGISEGATNTIVENVLTSTSTTNALSANQGKVLNDTKVDKVSGKGLSTNDFTAEEKEKLAGISEGATNTTVEDVLTSTSTTNALSANQGKILNDTKVDKVEGKGLSTNDFTTEEKEKLASIPDGSSSSITIFDANLTTIGMSPDQKVISMTAYDSYIFVRSMDIETTMFIHTCSNYIDTITMSWDINTDLKKWSRFVPDEDVGCISQVYYNDGIYIAVSPRYGPYSSRNAMYAHISTDGYNWETHIVKKSSENDQKLSSVCYGNNLYVAVGTTCIDDTNDVYRSAVFTSPDGISWTEKTLTTTNSLHGVCYGNNLFVAVGHNIIMTSPDGTTWTTRSTASYTLHSVKYVSGVFVAVGYYDTIMTSPDGISWTNKHYDSNRGTYLHSICYTEFMNRETNDIENVILVSGTNGIYASLFISKDAGATWNRIIDESTIDDIIAVVATEGDPFRTNFYLFALNRIYKSSDLVNWEIVTGLLNGVCYGNNGYIAVGESGMIYSSPDGNTWTLKTSGTTKDLNGVCYGDNLYMAVGQDGIILTSPDGDTWTPKTSGTTKDLNDVCYGDDLYVVGGQDGIILTSPDGNMWTERESTATERFTESQYLNGEYVLTQGGVWGGGIFSSPDGINWTKVLNGTIYSVCYGNGLYVANSNGSHVLAGPSLSELTQVFHDYDIIPYGAVKVLYCNGRYIMIGNSVISTSSDGYNWECQDCMPNIKNNISLSNACENDGKIIAVGSFNSVAYGGKRDIEEVILTILDNIRQ